MQNAAEFVTVESYTNMRSARDNCLVTFRSPWKVPFSLLACTIRAFGGGLTVLRLSKAPDNDDEEEEEEEEEE
jgi:hypothetical protein